MTTGGWRSGAGGRRACLALLVALLATRAAAAPSSEECLACHGNEGFADAAGRSLVVAPEAFAASVHAPFGCATCHADATEIQHAEHLQAVGLDTCAACHGDVVTAYRSGVHAAGHDGSAASCVDCHGPVHAIIAHDQPASAAHWSHLTAACATCHANALVDRAGIPVIQPVEAYLESVHGRSVARGQRAAVCSDCHGAHDILPPTNPASTIFRQNVPGTCGTCHADITAEYRDSVHGRSLEHGLREAPVCTDCHGEHRILSHTDPRAPVFAGNIPGETCGRCHGDLRLAAKYGLSAEKFSTFQDSFHGLALRAGRVGVANCASCHGVHHILPSSDPRSLVNPANLPTTCGRCHPGAGTNFAIGPVHVLPSASPTRLEHWVRLFYLWGIGLVIGFMALHTGIDFAAKARRWPPAPLPPPAAAPERMSRPLRWQHGLVMLTFPVLVYTGFALTYPESWWASPLLHFESRLALRGTIHRVAALVLLAALAWHAVHLWRNRRLRTQLRGMLWSWRDLRELGGRFAFYAGRRAAPPHGGAFSYIEKAEYWAFLWGMLIMTGTGLPLWFSSFMLRHLPKWITDVATAIHFYEAVLATLAILVWHLYWVVFDPEVYPMDWSWWSGRAPASRVRERQEGDGETRRSDASDAEARR